MADVSSKLASAKLADGEDYDLDTSALAALDKFRAEKAAEEAQLLRFTHSSSSTSRKTKKKSAKPEKKLTPEEEAAEEAKAEAALLAEIEAIADLERLNGVAPDSSDSMLANLTSRLQTDDDDDVKPEGSETGRSLDVDTFRKTFGESWQLSQFWYSSKFVHELSQLIFRLVSNQSTIPSDADSISALFGSARVAFLCCPTAWVGFVHEYPSLTSQSFVFEVDKRFHALSKTSFVYYNLHEPEKFPASLRASFDVIVADPPFLNVDTQSKVAQTAKMLAKPDAKFLLCTGKSIAEEARRMYGEPPLEKLDLVVEHHGLANAFGIWGRI
ncbi:Protein-lysine N-methyltransferase EFM5 [Pseudozyma hubeiensis]|nr:Protein-lysine N-methyltransferase EFM5 [Pseudozyma hubeiensis]